MFVYAVEDQMDKQHTLIKQLDKGGAVVKQLDQKETGVSYYNYGMERLKEEKRRKLVL